jgi:hypothetical protein
MSSLQCTRRSKAAEEDQTRGRQTAKGGGDSASRLVSLIWFGTLVAVEKSRVGDGDLDEISD